ncbi:unnamed protein product [Pieris macdunnoughi]|uniref:Nuclease HARBI1 n=1 Tax=Pieris macdunnoughi TaxID=345717 RepID=A0A821X4S9_9NEOP|nr:unnamed protein product [Pieris macdunnoughi]
MDRKKIIRKYTKLLIPLLVEELNELLEKEQQVEDPDEFRMLLRMDVQHFDTLLENITPLIQRQDTVMREAITAKTKLQVALCYLVTGASYRYLQAFYRVSRAAISSLIPEVMDAIFTYLETILKVPQNNEEWKEIELGSRTRWNFPGCHSAIDGKHVIIQAPPNCGTRTARELRDKYAEFFSGAGAVSWQNRMIS